MEINEQILKQFNLEVNSNYTHHSERMDYRKHKRYWLQRSELFSKEYWI